MVLPVFLSLLVASATPRAGVVDPDPTVASAVAGHALASAADAGFRVSELLRAESRLAAEVERGGFPGAALAIGRWSQTVVEQGIGTMDWSRSSLQVDPDHTIYDLASLTKVIATTTAVMLLVEDGTMELDAPVSRYLPEFSGGAKDRVTVRHLLTHTSGLPAWAELSGLSPESAFGRVLNVALEKAPGSRVEYSDLGFVLLWAAAERAHGQPLYRLLDERVYGPLAMRSTTYLPGEWCGRCAPTDPRPGYQGKVHDPIARRLGGIAGNAGLFSTVHDLARFAAMLANGGELDGVRVLQESTVHAFTQRQPGAGTRALGWDTPEADGGGAAGVRISQRAFGHTGFTGTSLWVDPDRGTWVVILANRTYEPKARNQIQAVRRAVHDRVAVAVDAAE